MGLVLLTAVVIMVSLYLLVDRGILQLYRLIQQLRCYTRQFTNPIIVDLAMKNLKPMLQVSRTAKKFVQIPLKQLLHILRKSRKLKQFVPKDISFKKSHQIFIIIQALLLLNMRVCMDKMFAPIARVNSLNARP